MKRTFITNVVTDSMFDECLGHEIIPEKSSLEEIKNEKAEDLISAIKEDALIGTLYEKGIELRTNKIKVTLLPGDVMYVISTSVPLYKVKEEYVLPPEATLTVKKYTVK